MIVILVMFSFTLIFIFCHFDFPANVCLFVRSFVCLFFSFERPYYIRIARKILCSVGVSRKGGILPYLALTVMCP